MPARICGAIHTQLKDDQWGLIVVDSPTPVAIHPSREQRVIAIGTVESSKSYEVNPHLSGDELKQMVDLFAGIFTPHQDALRSLWVGPRSSVVCVICRCTGSCTEECFLGYLRDVQGIQPSLPSRVDVFGVYARVPPEIGQIQRGLACVQKKSRLAKRCGRVMDSRLDAGLESGTEELRPKF